MVLAEPFEEISVLVPPGRPRFFVGSKSRFLLSLENQIINEEGDSLYVQRLQRRDVSFWVPTFDSLHELRRLCYIANVLQKIAAKFNQDRLAMEDYEAKQSLIEDQSLGVLRGIASTRKNVARAGAERKEQLRTKIATETTNRIFAQKSPRRSDDASSPNRPLRSPRREGDVSPTKRQ